ncbi:hypothetical protein L6R52_15665 [Myxococcota bacterium]|nr:hypothetical protein [Myxococcota bacterium]
MTTIKRKDLAQELERQSVHKGADTHKLVQDFVDPESGSRLIVSDEDGKVALLVPVADGYEGPKKVTVAPMEDPTKILDEVEKSRTIAVDGVGKFSEFILSPVRYRRALGAQDGEHRMIGLRGEGPDGFWSPLGFGGFFPEDLAMLTDLANREGMLVRPNGAIEPEVDPRDPTWKRLTEPERAAVELLLRRPVPLVVHQTVILEALERAAALGDGAIAGAVKSLTLSLDNANPEQELDDHPANATIAEEEARPALKKVFGPELFDRDKPLPRELLKLAEGVLTERKRDADATTVRMAIRGAPIADEEVFRAVDRAFGAGFSEKRKPTINLLDRVIDAHGDKLGDGLASLRLLRRELDYAREAAMFGAGAIDRPLARATADKKLNELYTHLRGKTGTDENATFTLAANLMAALNVPSPRPAVFIIAGERGGGVDTVFERAKRLTEVKPIETQAAAELRMNDPIGFLVGAPDDDPGAAKGIWVKERGAERFVASVDGVEGLAAQLAGDDRDRTKKQFWSFVAQVERDGWFRGYDPNDPEAAMGKKIDVGSGVIFLRTTESLTDLKASMPDDVWAQLAPRVISFEKAGGAEVVATMAEKLRAYVVDAYGLKDAKIEIAESASSFIHELVEGGMAAGQLQRAVVEQMIIPQIFFAAVDGSLAPRVRIELSRELTAKERNKIVAEWLDGKFRYLPGIGPSPFEVFDAGRFSPEAAERVSAKVKRELGIQKELESLRAELAEYKLAADGDQSKIDELLAANKRLSKYLDAAEHRIDEVNWKNERARWEIEDLTRLNKLANDTIVTLKGDLEKANGKIEKLNKDLGAMKKAGEEMRELAERARHERDEIYNALRTTETQFAEAIAQMADQGGQRDPGEVFDSIVHAAQQGNIDQRYHKAMLHQLHNVATSRALQTAMQHARSFNKWEEITRLANGYVRSSQALGVPLDGRVLEGFERAARLSGNGWNARMAESWEKNVGVASGHKGEDPGVLGNLTRNVLKQFGIRV